MTSGNPSCSQSPNRSARLLFAALLFATAIGITWARSPGWSAPWASSQEETEEEQETRPLTFLIWPHKVTDRLTPASFTRVVEFDRPDLRLVGLPGETLLAQVGLRATVDLPEVSFLASDIGDLVSGKYLRGRSIRFRFGQYLPIDERGQMTADPLIDMEGVVPAPGLVTIPVWMTIPLPKDLVAGRYTGGIEAGTADEMHYISVTIDVLDAQVPSREEWRHHPTVAVDPFALARRVSAPLGSPEHLEPFAELAAESSRRGAKSIYLPLFPPTSKSRSVESAELGLIEVNCDGAYEGIAGDTVRVEFSVLDPCLEILLAKGFEEIQLGVDPHPDSPEGDYFYFETQSQTYRRLSLRDTPSVTSRYQARLLEALQAHLDEKGWLDHTRLTLSDPETPTDPDPAVDPKARVNLGGSPPRLNPLPTQIPSRIDEARRFCWTHLASTPGKPRTILWLNRWPDDVFQQPRGPKQTDPSGASFLLYPGKKEPIGSLRWEMLTQGLQDLKALDWVRDRIQNIWERSERRSEELESIARATRTVLDRVQSGKLTATEGRSDLNALIPRLRRLEIATSPPAGAKSTPR